MESILAKCACAALIILSQLYGYYFIVARVRPEPLRKAIKAIYVIFNILGFSGFFLLHVMGLGAPDGFIFDYLVLAGIVWQSAHLLWLLPALALRLIVFLFSLVFSRREPKGLPKLFRAERTYPSLWNPAGPLLILFLALGLYSYLEELKGPEVSHLTLEFPGLPPELEGFRIVAVADLHYGRGMGLANFDTLMARIAAEAPSMVAFLGDMTDCGPVDADNLKEPLLKLRNTPFGVYAVLGDRDREANPDGNLVRMLSSAGVTTLENRRHLVHGAPVTLVGFEDESDPDDDPWPLDFLGRDPAFPFTLLTGPIPPVDNFTLVLSHQPGPIHESPGRQADLLLAGHTRGGQFQLPWRKDWNLAAPFRTYSSGLYESREAKILVTRGVSDSFFHLRFFAWPEINVITLKGLGPPRPGPGDSFGGQPGAEPEADAPPDGSQGPPDAPAN
ncbi:MAG: metallophosphoesterase [Deltaproteobacteria bacterium]|jgi:predicted MPP superfamily phosphohydrolase|nr:metallophosphoesterase [Deltaproteobacteria bacterium]